jgi:hypothetical protein
MAWNGDTTYIVISQMNLNQLLKWSTYTHSSNVKQQAHWPLGL